MGSTRTVCAKGPRGEPNPNCMQALVCAEVVAVWRARMMASRRGRIMLLRENCNGAVTKKGATLLMGGFSIIDSCKSIDNLYQASGIA